MKPKVTDGLFTGIWLLIMLIIADICNFADFLIGSKEIDTQTMTVTVIYITYCLGFAISSRNRKNFVFSATLGGSTLIISAIATIVGIYQLTSIAEAVIKILLKARITASKRRQVDNGNFTGDAKNHLFSY